MVKKVGLKVTLDFILLSLGLGVFLVLGSSSLLAQNCPKCDPALPYYCYASPACTTDGTCLTGTPVKLDFLWRFALPQVPMQNPPQDRTSTSDNFERNAYLDPTKNNIFDGGIFYVPAQGSTVYNSSNGTAVAGTTLLNRWYRSTPSDHKDSTGTEAGYSVDISFAGGVVGHPWSSQVSGLGVLEQLQQAFNNISGDYATLRPSESLAGYLPTPMGVYGWPRNNNTKDENDLVYAQIPNVLYNLTIASNKNAGGAPYAPG